MAYEETCAGALAALEDMRAVAWGYGDDAAEAAYNASIQVLIGKPLLAIPYLVESCAAAARGIKNHAGLVEPFYPLSPLEWYLTHGCIEATVTWKAICEAWIKNDFEGRMVTIACIDRMRQILWDEPFFVAWAARPEKEIE